MSGDDRGVPAESPVARELAEYRDRTRALLNEWRAAGKLRSRNDSWVRSFDLDFSREFGRRGLIGVAWPREVGGGGRSFKTRLAITEELLRAGAPINAHWFADRQIGPAIYRTGTPALQQELLPAILRGEAIFCICMSEPGAGSDLASVTTSAVRVSDGWLLNGRKIWTTNAHRATQAYVLARSDNDAEKHAGLSEYIVDMATPGISVSPILDMSGEHHFNEVLFEDVHVPAHRLLGREGNGWRQVVEQLSFERGGPERVLSSYPLLTELRRRLSDSDLGLLEEVGRLTARLATLRQMCWRITGALDAGGAPVQEAATLKYLGTQFEQDVVETARRSGVFEADWPQTFSESLLAAPSFTIRGGALEVLLGMIAKSEVH